MIIRRFRSEDAAEVARLHRGTIRQINSRDYDTHQVRVWSEKSSAKKFRGNMHEITRFVGVIDDTIVGFAEYTPKGEITGLYIHKDFQRRGVAKRLYAHLEEHARTHGIKKFYLTSTITAKPFYEKAGFTVQKEHFHTIADQQLRVFAMEKVISS